MHGDPLNETGYAGKKQIWRRILFCLATSSSRCLPYILVELLGRELGVGVNLEIVFKTTELDQLIY